MNEQQLQALVGMDINDAEHCVKKAGFQPRSHEYGEVTISIGLPRDVVELRYEHNIVVSAQTQASIDAKYQKGKP